MELFPQTTADYPKPTATGIRVGTAGYSYADWKGPFYPSDLAEGDMLPYYAQHFPVVEVNYSYYRLPAASTSQSMISKAPNLEFVFKLFGGITHEAEPQWSDLTTFRQGIAPITESGKMPVVLAQFPWSFKPDDAAWDRLVRVAEGLRGVAVNIEFRNIAWHSSEVRERLKATGLGIVNVDEPRLKCLLPPSAFATNHIGYVRMHGRNAKKWWKHERAEERYDYTYPVEELMSCIERLREINRHVERSFVIFNNHPLGQAVVAAQEMLALLAQESM